MIKRVTAIAFLILEKRTDTRIINISTSQGRERFLNKAKHIKFSNNGLIQRWKSTRNLQN